MKSSNGEIAEKLFLEACALQGWSAAKIPTGLTKTPDYKVESKSGSYIAEVKQISLSGYELGKAHSFKVGAKIRSAIGDAKNQLRDLELPTMLVVCDLRGAGLATYENIVAAMYGELTVTVDKHTGAIEGPFHGRNAQMRNNVNTSISAVAQVSYDLTNYDGNQDSLVPFLTIYHNMYAKVPFKKDFFKDQPSILEYWFASEDKRSFA